MTANELLEALQKLTPKQLEAPVWIGAEYTVRSDEGTDEQQNIDEPATSCGYTGVFEINSR